MCVPKESYVCIHTIRFYIILGLNLNNLREFGPIFLLFSFIYFTTPRYVLTTIYTKTLWIFGNIPFNLLNLNIFMCYHYEPWSFAVPKKNWRNLSMTNATNISASNTWNTRNRNCGERKDNVTRIKIKLMRPQETVKFCCIKCYFTRILRMRSDWLWFLNSPFLHSNSWLFQSQTSTAFIHYIAFHLWAFSFHVVIACFSAKYMPLRVTLVNLGESPLVQQVIGMSMFKIQSTLPKSKSHKSNNRLSRSHISRIIA